jgi:hypothetical protein
VNPCAAFPLEGCMEIFRSACMNPDVMGVWVLVAMLGAAWLIFSA